MDHTVGFIAALTGAAIVFVCLNYGDSIGRKRRQNKPEVSLHQTLHSGRYNKETPKVTHQGSCHCNRIRFQIKAPADLAAIDIPSKVRYPRLSVPCSTFEFLSNKDDCSLYAVTSPSGGEQGIHTFCSYCGVHILYAPSANPIMIHVNVDCLSHENIRSISVAYHDVIETVPAELFHREGETNTYNRRGSGSMENIVARPVEIPNIVTPINIEESSLPPSTSSAATEIPFSNEQQQVVEDDYLSAIPTNVVRGFSNNSISPEDSLWSAVAEGFYDSDILEGVPTAGLSKRYSTFNKDEGGGEL